MVDPVHVEVKDNGGNAPGGNVIVDVARTAQGTMNIQVSGSTTNSDYQGYPKKVSASVSIDGPHANLVTHAQMPEGQFMAGDITRKSMVRGSDPLVGCQDVPLNQQVALDAGQADAIRGLGEKLLKAGTKNEKESLALQISDAVHSATCRPAGKGMEK